MPTVRGHGGLPIAYEASGAPDFLFVHANGFCKEVWWPVIEELGAPGFVSIDQPGHGGSGSPAFPFDWWDFGRHALAVIDAVGADRPVGVGHSSGATTLAMAEILRPGTFERLVLVEPIAPPPPYARVEDHPLISGALRRRATFGSSDDAYDAYRGRGPFARWDDRALRAYVDHGFATTTDGWTLRCAPEVEAEIYRGSGAHGAWDRFGEIACPVKVIAGEHSDTHHEEFARRQAKRFRYATLEVVPDATHFVPMERPDLVAAAIQAG